MIIREPQEVDVRNLVQKCTVNILVDVKYCFQVNIGIYDDNEDFKIIYHKIYLT